MNKPHQFLPSLKQMLGFYRWGPLPLALFTASCAGALVVSSVSLPMGWMDAHLQPSLWGDQVFQGCIALWFLLMLVGTPLPFQVLGGTMSLEFLFTRAVDRGLWLRTERAAVVIIALGPLVLNLAFSSLGPELAFPPALAGSDAASLQARYLQIFPGSHTMLSLGSGEELVIRHGSAIFAAFLLWAAWLCVFLVAGYFTVVFTAWQRGGWHHSKSRLRAWLGAAMAFAPAYSAIFLFLLCAALHFNIFEEAFLLFAQHPLWLTLAVIVFAFGVQRLSERNIRKLEFEFF